MTAKVNTRPSDQQSSRPISDMDEYLFHEGKHFTAYNFMGAHPRTESGHSGIRFTTWAPKATRIYVIGDFNYWQISDQYAMNRFSGGGIWSVFIPGVSHGAKYKFAVFNDDLHSMVYKCDPYAFCAELRPNTASIIHTQRTFAWSDHRFLAKRARHHPKTRPMNIYELHLATWRTKDGHFLSYQELSDILPGYVKDMGFTHVELMPLHEHPLDKSWGYQATGFFAATCRHGDLSGLKQLINQLHLHDIGVILDWVPGHFCKDEHGLINFDGQACYEYQDYRKANNKGWGTHNFDLGRNEVRCFLISNAIYWLTEFHIDGLRVDAVSNILYLDYDRAPHEWEPNQYGNNHNLEALSFLKELNHTLKQWYPGVITIAEESSAWPQVTTSVADGGLGFDFKWNMGWMNDTLRYIELDPIYRQYHHQLINFAMMYHYSEQFILPISHDEVVHGKNSLLNKMWGDLWIKFAGVRLYACFMFGHPGKKLLFMGCEFAQFSEWRDYEQLPWEIIDDYPPHRQTLNFFKQLNHFYLKQPALWLNDYTPDGFQWIDADNNRQSILSFVRHATTPQESLIFICNFTPLVYYDYEIGVPYPGEYQQVFNSDQQDFGGSNQIVDTTLTSIDQNRHGCAQHVRLKIPPMAAIVLQLVN